MLVYSVHIPLFRQPVRRKNGLLNIHAFVNNTEHLDLFIGEGA